jgi:hypothetical protein
LTARNNQTQGGYGSNETHIAVFTSRRQLKKAMQNSKKKQWTKVGITGDESFCW